MLTLVNIEINIEALIKTFKLNQKHLIRFLFCFSCPCLPNLFSRKLIFQKLKKSWPGNARARFWLKHKSSPEQFARKHVCFCQFIQWFEYTTSFKFCRLVIHFESLVVKKLISEYLRNHFSQCNFLKKKTRILFQKLIVYRICYKEE